MPGPIGNLDAKRASRNAERQSTHIQRDPDLVVPPLPESVAGSLMPEAAETARRYWEACWRNVGPLLQDNPAMVLELERAAMLSAQICELGVEAPASLHAQLTALGDRLGATYLAMRKMKLEVSPAPKPQDSNLAAVVDMPEAALTPVERAKRRAARAD